jgi:predicted TIM-barrel fold metal-dependent hydrolase
MKRRTLVPLVALVATVSLLRAQTPTPAQPPAAPAQTPTAPAPTGPPPPIIDMHLHALEPDAQGPPPMGMCPGAVVGIAVMEPKRSWAETFMERFKKPPCANPIWSPKTAVELMERTYAVMKRRNVYGVTSGSLTDRWKAAFPDRIIPSLAFELGEKDAMSPADLRTALSSGRYRAFGEVSNQYQGFDPSDPSFEAYLAVVEELDFPMSIHVGTGPPGAPYLGYPKYRAWLHSPLTIEEALIRHPKLRVSLMHAGWPMLDDLLAVMWTHPQVYVDVGIISYALPRAGFHDYLRRIVEAGFGKRVMFGSDQMVWPEALESAIQAVETAAFLTTAQKRDIFFNNAVRFLRLTDKELVALHAR